jgi:hypothetical protein
LGGGAKRRDAGYDGLIIYTIGFPGGNEKGAMMFWVRMFITRFKTAVTPSFCAAVLLLMGFILALGIIFNQETGMRIRVGLLDAEPALISRAQYYAQADCEIIVYTDLEQMKLDVAAHKLESAYVFPINENDLITAYRSPWTVSGAVLDLIIAAAYVEGLAGVLGEEALAPFADRMSDPDDKIDEMIQAKTENYLRDGVLMETVYVETGSGIHKGPAVPYRRLFHGLTGLFGLLLALLYAMGTGGADTALVSRIRAAGRSAGGYAMVGVAVTGFITGLFMNATVLAGGVLYPGVVQRWGTELLLGWVFAFAAAGLAMVLNKLFKSDGAGLAVFLFIAAGLLGGAIFDIREIWANAAFTRYLFPNHYYLEGILQAGGLQMVVLAVIGLVSSCLCILISVTEFAGVKISK